MSGFRLVPAGRYEKPLLRAPSARSCDAGARLSSHAVPGTCQAPGSTASRSERAQGGARTERPRRRPSPRTRRGRRGAPTTPAVEAGASASPVSGPRTRARAAPARAPRAATGAPQRDPRAARGTRRTTRSRTSPRTAPRRAERRTRDRATRGGRQRRLRSRGWPEAHGVPRPVASRSDRTVLLCSGRPSERSSMASLTWLGHATFRLDTDDGKRVYVDPLLSGNPKTPENEKSPDRADAIYLTHGHGDHLGDVVELQNRLGCKVLGIVELVGWLSKNGIAEDNLIAFNKGGSVELDGIRYTMTNAFHSSSAPDLSYTGEPTGVVIHADGRRVYFAGDTCVFGDMQLIARLYRPDVAVLPIGDHFTMGPEEAALALELLGNPRCMPCHFGTWPVLAGTPDELAKLTPAQVERIQPGDSVQL